MRKWLAFGFLAALMSALSVAQQTGSLTLSTEAHAEIFWQGASIGFADDSGLIKIDGIPVGSYAILITKPGFLAESTQTRIVSGPQQQQFNLTPLTGRSLPEITISGSDSEIPSEIAASAGEDPSVDDNRSRDSSAAEAGVTQPPDGTEPVTNDSSEQPLSAETRPETPFERGSTAGRRSSEDPAGRASDFQIPGNVPAPPSTESDLRILIWWGVGLVALVGLLHLFRRKNREDLAQEQASVSDFSRAMSPNRANRNDHSGPLP